jgi:nicotinate-nucleotide adenylyltransferase
MFSSPMSDEDGGSLSASPLGIFGGTFDPVHFGHLRLAEEACGRLGLGQVLWLPAGQPPLRELPQTPAADRVAMVRLAIANNPQFALDSTEADAPEPSYTVTSLRRLRAVHDRQRPLVLLLGADAFARLDGWHCWRELFELAHIAVATRPGHRQKVGAGETALDAEFRHRQGAPANLTTAPAGRIVPFQIQALDISATALRRYLAAGESSRYLAPDAVLDYIHLHQLYCS